MSRAKICFLCMCVISACSFDLVASDCNCEEGCARNLLHRCGSCKAGWYGPYCQKKNVALNGNASQQGIFNEADAGLAVDGIITTKPELNKCAHTDRRNNSWWSVQLRDNGVNQIRYMKIYNRDEMTINLWRRMGMEILIDGKRCKKWADSAVPGTIEDVTCIQTLMGHNLTISVLGAYYSVCEVQVFVCSDGWFGEACEKQCNCLNPNDLCDKVDGRCKLGCKTGYTGYDCQTRCQDGWYGPSCSSTCGHCVNKTVCNKTTGDCSWGCSDGWSGRKCDVCKDGRYEQDCSERCGHCANNVSCDTTTGHCAAGCEDGWEDERCDKDCSIKWHVLPTAVTAFGTGLFITLLFAGIHFCLLRQGRLRWMRSQVSRDQVRMSDVARQQDHPYLIPTHSGLTATDTYDVIQEGEYENI